MEILIQEIERLEAIRNLSEDELLREQLSVSVMFLRKAQLAFAEAYLEAQENGYKQGYTKGRADERRSRGEGY